jgi:hypothetical protein
MNICAPKGLTIEQHKKVIELYKCNCSSSKLRPLAFVIGENNSAFVYECIECYKTHPFVYTKKPLSTYDTILVIVNNVEDLKKQLEKESPNICSKCKSGSTKSIDVIKCKRMALDILECNKCGFSVPAISVVRSTLFAYSYDIQLGKKVAKEYPQISLVLCVSALETYFRQLFKYRSELNEFLVKKRRVNFQSLKETKAIFKKEFGIDIVKLVEKDWQFLNEKFEMRHGIIHNASFDKYGNKIDISEQGINKLFSIVDDLVYKIEMELFNNCIVI